MTVTTLGRLALPSGAEFFIRRVARIYPPLWIVSSLLLLVYLWQPSLINSHSSFPPDIGASFMALPQRGSPLLLVSWSLVYEMYFYCVFTFALCFGRLAFTPILAIWSLATAILSFASGSSENPWLIVVSNPICLEFLVGVAVGGLILRGKYSSSPLWLYAGLAFYGVEAFLGFGTGWWRVLASLPLALILYSVVGLERNAKLVLPAFLDKLGDASYATYLWHIPVLALFGIAITRIHLGPVTQLQEAGLLLLGIALVEAVGLAVYHYVERPLTRALTQALLMRKQMTAISERI